MIVFEYEIDDQWYGMPYPTALTLPAAHREVHQQDTYRTIVQILRPPRHLEDENSIVVREAWEQGTYFPSIWLARPDIYKNPYTIIKRQNNRLIVARMRHEQPPHASQADYVALLETADGTIVSQVLRHKTAYPHNLKLLGVFERV